MRGYRFDEAGAAMRSRWRAVGLAAAVALAGLLGGAPGAQASVVEADGPGAVIEGDLFDVTVSVPSGGTLSSLALSITYDDAILQLFSAVQGAAFSGLVEFVDFFGSIDASTPGQVDVDAAFLADITGAAELYVLGFEAIAPGLAVIDVTGNAVTPAGLESVSTATTTSVAPIPLPLSGALLLTALPLLLLRRKRAAA